MLINFELGEAGNPRYGMSETGDPRRPTEISEKAFLYLTRATIGR